ncbi:bifunctional diaminohydroxyphosphoribosylaminopyrimidine deaminase/5-amino-6-(5-phosphoribosylamino)uracil reductase RibD [Vibrio albus]|uniref:Riboflavin biosynthesis protein RibD n=1 Tax=Vibrio albus TaxID=2200953 RepID=A0A2U3BCI1_9VIBR|nr:bifunctional diaminohydroxyphosphoribosylaminopyrimidine deaminase/5-amino-6-(5-phosphoribosylamino)uracil reductase RibD [Vibrio albus]PWI34500.1 bifunctional diaminohydroxyphosphoribosylaminopyrimidine deaminase/5-amino-6-(5-phosphoribosylamino)uracil reductase RibD [Vibrio albus]
MEDREHPFTSFDYQMMSRAIKLARQGIYTTAPNPNVGCVIAKDGEIIGEGFHFRAGEPHAEVHALRAAAGNTAGATAYVTLEPCSHYGRTPPCAEALIKSQVTRVVCAMQDPNPQVAGRGIRMLQEAGIEVQVGLLEQDAKALNPAFIKRMQTGMPFVQLKMAASLDGRTALKNGVSQWITSPQARQDVQVYRAQAGAILSSSKTVLDDNASLAVRWDELPGALKQNYPEQELRQPARVILDRQQQLTSDLRLYQSGGKVIRIFGENQSTDCGGADIQVPLTESGHLDLYQVLHKLATEHNINHVWVEAGATLAASFIEQALVDELIVYMAPKLMGADGQGVVNLLGLESMDQAINLNIRDVRMVGPDIRLVADIKKNAQIKKE